MEALINEIREEFHIPPYYPDAAIERQVNEGLARLLNLNPGKNYEDDLVLRMLVKNYAYYAYIGSVHLFMENYASTILEWQLESEV